LRLALLAGLALTLAACAAPDAADSAGGGGPTPGGVVESFIEDFNQALQDPRLADSAARRGWAERLAGYFAPSERIDQRAAFNEMLYTFASTAQNPVVGSKVAMAITYTRVELISSGGDRALVRVVDGSFDLRWFDQKGEVLRERTGGLTEVIGQQSGGLPVLRVGGLWFLTEG
jgi:hypothetical protein